MSLTLSRFRAQQARERDRASRARGPRRKGDVHPLIAAAVAAVLWLDVMIMLHGGAWAGVLRGRAPDPQALSDAALLLLSLLASGVFLRLVKPQLIRRTALVGMLALIALAAVGMGRLLVELLPDTPAGAQTIGFILPYVMAPMLATILVDSVAGLAVGLWSNLALTLLVRDGDRLPHLVMGMVAALLCAELCRDLRTRGKAIRAGLLVGLGQLMCVAALAALRWQTTDAAVVARQSLACLGGGFLSALVVLVVLPLFEWAFKVTSNIALFDLSDLGHPLLQRLSLEAPGTYHHSMMVAALAREAAAAIGANSLLAQVGAYYHDIGKLVKPGYFTENIGFHQNPHDDLQPGMSTLVITAHVKEGLGLAALHRLPDAVQTFIREHHGTSVLRLFHRKAVLRQEQESGEPDERVDESGFRYGGPKPHARESAILAIADGVEAASRSLTKPTLPAIEDMVERIVRIKTEDGQLDECDLTFAELGVVKRSLIVTTANMLHGRVPYPTDEHHNHQSPSNDGPRPPTNSRPG